MYAANKSAGMRPLDAFYIRVRRTFGMGQITQDQFDQVVAHIEAIRDILNVNEHNKNKNKSDEVV